MKTERSGILRSRFLRDSGWIAPLVVLLLATIASASHVTVVNNGPNANRVNIVFLGDGYTAGEINSRYPAHIAAMTNHMFFPPAGSVARDPYPRYRNYFNVHRVNVTSLESGADVAPENIFRDTALDAQYFYDGATERRLYIDESKANSALAAGLADADFTAEIRLVTVNDTRYGGAGGNYAVYAGGNTSAPEIALHEMGHSFNGLADEYGGYTLPYGGLEPAQLNATKDSTGAKWSQWLGYNQPGVGVIGAYEGARYFDFGLFRPSPNSKMRTLGFPFDAVSREKIILDIYNLVDPLDDYLSNALPLVDPAELWVDSIDPGVINFEWFVDGVKVPGALGETFSLLDFGFGPGIYNVQARAFDPTGFDPLNGWVRRDQDQLEQFVSWTVTETVPEPATIIMFAVGIVIALLTSVKKRRRNVGRISHPSAP